MRYSKISYKVAISKTQYAPFKRVNFNQLWIRFLLALPLILYPRPGTAIVRVDREQTSEMTRLLPQRRVTATVQTQTEHNEECGCKSITTAVGNSSNARCAAPRHPMHTYGAIRAR